MFIKEKKVSGHGGRIEGQSKARALFSILEARTCPLVPKKKKGSRTIAVATVLSAAASH